MADANRKAWVEREETALAKAHATLTVTAQELVTHLDDHRREGGSLAGVAYRYLRYKIASDRLDSLCRAYIQEEDLILP